MPDTPEPFDLTGNVDRLLLAFRLIAESVDLEAIIRTIGLADAVGPFVDPTAYRDALYRGDMHDIEALAHALEPALKVWADRIAPKLVPA